MGDVTTADTQDDALDRPLSTTDRKYTYIVIVTTIIVLLLLYFLLSLDIFSDDDPIDEDLEIDVNDVVFTDAVWLNDQLIRPLDPVIYPDGVMMLINISVTNSGSEPIDINDIMFHVYSSTDGHINYINWGTLSDPRFTEGAFHIKRGILEEDDTIVGWLVFLVPGLWEDRSRLSFDYSLGFAGPVYHVRDIDLTMSEHLGTIPPRINITVDDWVDTDHVLDQSTEPGNTFIRINVTVGSLWSEPVEIDIDDFILVTDGEEAYRIDDITKELDGNKYNIDIPPSETVAIELVFQIPSSYDPIELQNYDGVLVTCPIGK